MYSYKIYNLLLFIVGNLKFDDSLSIGYFIYFWSLIFIVLIVFLLVVRCWKNLMLCGGYLNFVLVLLVCNFFYEK